MCLKLTPIHELKLSKWRTGLLAANEDWGICNIFVFKRFQETILHPSMQELWYLHGCGNLFISSCLEPQIHVKLNVCTCSKSHGTLFLAEMEVCCCICANNSYNLHYTQFTHQDQAQCCWCLAIICSSMDLMTSTLPPAFSLYKLACTKSITHQVMYNGHDFYRKHLSICISYNGQFWS